MLLPLLTLYVAFFVAACASTIIDLWAKSYDFPLAQLRAKAALAGLAGLACAGAASLGGAVLGSAATPAARLGSLATLTPLLIGLLGGIYLLNWRSVYAASLLALLLVLIVPPIRSYPAQAAVAAVLSLGVACLAVYSRFAVVRRHRYTRLLYRGCSCCGHKQRAVHELCALGETGERVIHEYFSRLKSWEEAPVKEEWQRCRTPYLRVP